MALSFLASVIHWLPAQLTATGELAPVERFLVLTELAIGLAALALVRRLGRPRPRPRPDEVDYPEAA